LALIVQIKHPVGIHDQCHILLEEDF